MQDVYAAKGSKTFWHYNIGYYKKWGNSNRITLNMIKIGEIEERNEFSGTRKGRIINSPITAEMLWQKETGKRYKDALMEIYRNIGEVESCGQK